MPFWQIQTKYNAPILTGLFVMTLCVITLGAARDYSFIPSRATDGFAAQLQYIEGLIASGQWTDLLSSPLKIVHLLRLIAVWPFITAETYFGSVGSLSLLILCLIPLIMSFRTEKGDWRDLAYLGVRFLTLLLPLAVSGRTVLVIAGMGYLVSGVISRPFSTARIGGGVFLSVLSSASILFSLAILVVGGNGRDRSRRFYITKLVTILLVIAVFVPSLFAKVEGFSSGTPGYAYEEQDEVNIEKFEANDTSEDSLGTGMVPALKRILGRSTVAESYREGNFLRLGVYLSLIGAAIGYLARCLITRHRNPINIILCVLALGIFLEGLALWPIVFPILWAYTGMIGHRRLASQTQF